MKRRYRSAIEGVGNFLWFSVILSCVLLVFVCLIGGIRCGASMGLRADAPFRGLLLGFFKRLGFGSLFNPYQTFWALKWAKARSLHLARCCSVAAAGF